ncbi:hypothetical protein AALA24_07500 [Anaerovoracaceae bacterium 42-11]|nr:hypothetical protein [Emergencia sp.]
MLVEFAEYVENDDGNSMKQAAQEIAIEEKILTEFFWNRKNTVPVIAVNEL